MSSLVSLASSSSSLARVHVANVISISNLDQIWKFTLEQMGKCFYSALCVLWIYIIHIVIDLNIITVIILISPNSFMCYQVLSDTKTPPSLSGLFTFPLATPWIWRLLQFQMQKQTYWLWARTFQWSERKEEKDFFIFTSKYLSYLNWLRSFWYITRHNCVQKNIVIFRKGCGEG